MKLWGKTQLVGLGVWSMIVKVFEIIFKLSFRTM